MGSNNYNILKSELIKASTSNSLLELDYLLQTSNKIKTLNLIPIITSPTSFLFALLQLIIKYRTHFTINNFEQHLFDIESNIHIEKEALTSLYIDKHNNASSSLIARVKDLTLEEQKDLKLEKEKLFFNIEILKTILYILEIQCKYYPLLRGVIRTDYDTMITSLENCKESHPQSNTKDFSCPLCIGTIKEETILHIFHKCLYSSCSDFKNLNISCSKCRETLSEVYKTHSP